MRLFYLATSVLAFSSLAFADATAPAQTLLVNHSKISESIQVYDDIDNYRVDIRGLNSYNKEAVGVSLGVIEPNSGLYSAQMRFPKSACIIRRDLRLLLCTAQGPLPATFGQKTLDLFASSIEIERNQVTDVSGNVKTSFSMRLFFEDSAGNGGTEVIEGLR